jgi:hypothetical protein
MILILYSRLAINPTVLLIAFIQALSKGTMEEILRQQIEKIVPLTDDEGFQVVSPFRLVTIKTSIYCSAVNPVPYVHFVVKLAC